MIDDGDGWGGGPAVAAQRPTKQHQQVKCVPALPRHCRASPAPPEWM